MTSERECGFCGKRVREVRAMVEGPNVRICNECVELSWDIVRPEPDEPPAAPRKKNVDASDEGGALHCSFCGKPEHEVSKLLSGIETFICDACIGVARADLEARGELSGTEKGPTHYCSFCGKPQTEVAKIIAGPSVNICSECVALCQNVFSTPATEGPADKPAAERDGDGDAHPQLYCSFCGEPRSAERRLIAGPTVFICNDCIGISVDLCAGKEVPGTGPPDGG